MSADITQSLHVAKFLQLDRNVQHMLGEMQRMGNIIQRQDKKIRELHDGAQSFVSHAECLAIVTGRRSMSTRLVEREQHDSKYDVVVDKMDDLALGLKELRYAKDKLEQQSKFASNLHDKVGVVPVLFCGVLWYYSTC